MAVYKQVGVLIVILNIIGSFVALAKIYTHNKDNGLPVIVSMEENEKLSDVAKSRLRRDTLPIVGDNKRPAVSVTQLPEYNQKEAIVHWSGKRSSVMFVLTRQHILRNGSVPSSSLWRSTDYGSHFTKVNFTKDTVIRYYYSQPLNRSKLIFTDVKNKQVHVTTDEGATFHPPLAVPITPDRIVFHPQNEDWLLVYSFDERRLYMSDNLGRTWNHVSDDVMPTFYWAVPNVDSEKSTIHLQIQDQITGKYQYKSCIRPYCTETTIDKELGPVDADSLVVQNEYIFVQKSTLYSGHLYVSHRRGPFRRAYFPFNVHPQDFSIVNTDNGQVFIASDHWERTVNLYLSDATGQFYVESLRHVVGLRRNEGGFVADVYEVKGLKGVFIANRQESGSGSPKTVITFDQGAKWQHIMAPELDAQNRTTNCRLPDCSLHLHLGFSASVYRFPYILSEDNAPGMILAQGKIGPELTPEPSTLFFSSDGGMKWKALFEGEYNYNILDQGGAMVVVSAANEDKQMTSEIKYSCTEGTSWKTYQFMNSSIQVDGVLNEPGITTTVVSIYGHSDAQTGWVIVKVDFTPVLSRNCTEGVDYDVWNPRDDIKECLMGQKLQYQRRKPTSECLNGIDYEHAFGVTPCKCQDYDFECDFGYERQTDADGSCTVASWFDVSTPIMDCPVGTYYNKSSGYRLIASNNCTLDLTDPDYNKYKSTLTPCPVTKPVGLVLSSLDKTTLRTGKIFVLQLHQERGSKRPTKYSFDFGNGTTANVTGYESATRQVCRYMTSGVYEIQLVASNDAGSARASIKIHVEDEVGGIYLTIPHGAKVNSPVKFEVMAVSSKTKLMEPQKVHYVWKFGDEGDSDLPFLTFSQTANHTYKEAKNYTVMVEAVNSVSAVFEQFVVQVYTTLQTVQLTFDPAADMMNDHTPAWKKMFGDLLKNALMEPDVLNVDHTRLEVAVVDTTPLRADVSILPVVPSVSTSTQSINTLVETLVTGVNQNRVWIDFESSGFDNDRIMVVSANVLPDEKPEEHKQDFTAVFVCVPILIAAVFVSVLVVMYYKRKFTTTRRYSVLHSQSSETEDSLLENDDDDVPPLDPNPDHPLEEDLGVRQGGPPALVMMTGTNIQESNHALNV